LILRSLIWGPRHGYDVTRWLREASEDALRIEEGALYQALHRMEARGWVEAEWGLSENNRRAKFYRLTAEGRAQLRRETSSWRDHVETVARVLQFGHPPAGEPSDA
jgi:transcriptional regulator